MWRTFCQFKNCTENIVLKLINLTFALKIGKEFSCNVINLCKLSLCQDFFAAFSSIVGICLPLGFVMNKSILLP